MAERTSDVMTHNNKLQDSVKQTGMADDCSFQTRKPSIFQKYVIETRTLRTFPLFLSEHAYIV